MPPRAVDFIPNRENPDRGRFVHDHACGSAVASAGVGELVYQGDHIETGADGEVAILFVDGATFQLFAGTQVVLDEFIYAREKSSNSAALRVAKGKFGFITGKVASTGRFVVDTPRSRIRSVIPAGGLGAAAFLFMLCVIRDAEAAPSPDNEEDREELTANDLEHGVFEVIIDGEVHSVGDTRETLVVRHRGSSTSIERVANSPQQMAVLEREYGRAAENFKAGQQDAFFLQMQKAANEHASNSAFASAFNLTQFAGLIAKPPVSVLQPPPSPPSNTEIPDGDSVGSGSHVTYAPVFFLLPVSNDQRAGPVFLGPESLAHPGPTFIHISIPNLRLSVNSNLRPSGWG